jgi:hypothetical protein
MRIRKANPFFITRPDFGSQMLNGNFPSRSVRNEPQGVCRQNYAAAHHIVAEVRMRRTRVKWLMQEIHIGNVLPSHEQIATDFAEANGFYLEASPLLNHILRRQGPWNADLRTPPGPEGSNGSLLCICRGHPGTSFQLEMKSVKFKMPGRARTVSILHF